MGSKQKYLIYYSLLLLGLACLSAFLGSGSLFNLPSKIALPILTELRLPRITLAISIGGLLAFCGAVFQSMLRNPLAEPYILGVSNGCCIGALLGYCLNFSQPMLWLSSFLSGSLVVWLVLFISRNHKSETQNESLLLSGVMVSSVSAGIIFLLLHLVGSARSAIAWMLGDLGSIEKFYGYFSIILFIIVFAISFFLGNVLNALSLGEQEAKTLGINTTFSIKFLYIFVSLLIGISVSMCGAIGFVGLVVPHLVRYKFGADNKFLLPMAVICGAIFLLFCDTISRALPAVVGLNSGEIPVGAVTALVGAPIFIFLSRK